MVVGGPSAGGFTCEIQQGCDQQQRERADRYKLAKVMNRIDTGNGARNNSCSFTTPCLSCRVGTTHWAGIRQVLWCMKAT